MSIVSNAYRDVIVFGLVMIVLIGTAQFTFASGTRTAQLVPVQGSGTTVAFGDYVASNSGGGGLNTYHRYLI